MKASLKKKDFGGLAGQTSDRSLWDEDSERARQLVSWVEKEPHLCVGGREPVCLETGGVLKPGATGIGSIAREKR